MLSTDLLYDLLVSLNASDNTKVVTTKTEKCPLFEIKEQNN